MRRSSPQPNSPAALINALDRRELDPFTPISKLKGNIAGHASLVGRLHLERKLEGHMGCVNTVQWTKNGQQILTGSDDCRLNIWDPFAPPGKTPLLSSVISGHEANIFSAKFVPFSEWGPSPQVVSCAADGMVRYTDFNQTVANGGFSCHSDIAYEVVVDPNSPNLFWSASDDGTVNQYDLRQSTHCACEDDHCNRHVLIDLNAGRGGKTDPSERVDNPRSDRAPSPSFILRQLFSDMGGVRPPEIGCTTMDINPLRTEYLALGCTDDVVRIYDRRRISNGSDTTLKRKAGEVYTFCPSHMRRSLSAENDTDSDGDGTSMPSARIHGRHHKMTSLKYDPTNSGDILVSYSREKVYLVRPGNGDCGAHVAVSMHNVVATAMEGTGETKKEESKSKETNHEQDLPPTDGYCKPQRMNLPPSLEKGRSDTDIVRVFCGHRNERTMIKEANFFGPNSEYVLSGSDDGRIFVWHKSTGKVCCLLMGDQRVVNCLQPHPFDPILATSGIDSDLKIWWPTATEPWSDWAGLDEIIKRNERGRRVNGVDVDGIGADNDNGTQPRVLVMSPDMMLRLFALMSGREGF
ncbi:hypothetical protein SpCBS45565_g00826 [Spizellomyces sp. 'palustris']|nr:hypothetical protein SpCBS45565_g00826 [Spizellomyces sp. 'palustris']